jgi:hypothetical protein
MGRLRRLGVWGLGTALLLAGGTAVPAASDDGDDSAAKPAATSSWFGHLFGSPSPPKKPDKDKDKDKDKEKLPPKTVPTPHAPARNEAALIRAREEEALLRRLEVCDKLKQIAERTGDEELGKMAEQLDGRARDLYFQRIAHLPASRATPDLDALNEDRHVERSGVESMPSKPLPHAVSGAEVHTPAREEEP